MLQDSTSTMLRSAKHFFSGTMISRLSGLMRDVAMAYAFGTEESVAAFLMAFRFAHLLRRLFGEGALQSVFVPFFEDLRRTSPVEAGRFFTDLYASLGVFLSAIIMVGMLLCGALVGFKLVSAGNQEVLMYTLVMLPSLVFICFFGLNAGLLQCERRYFLPSVASVAFNMVWVVAALALSGQPIKEAMVWLSGVIILACACQWAMTLPAMIKILKGMSFYDSWKKITFFSPAVFKLIPPLLLAIVGVSASQINNALDVIFARFADPAGPAYLWYAIRMQQLPLALFGIALSGALLPPLSRALKQGDISQFRHFLGFGLKQSLRLMIPMTAGIFLLGGASIRLLYGYGDFTDTSIAGTLGCLLGYGIGLVPMTLVLILAPAFYAKSNFSFPTWGSMVSMAVNVLLNAWFIMGLSWGASSVAVATSLSAIVNVLILGYGLKEDLKAVLTKSFFGSVTRTCLATILGSMAVLMLEPYIQADTPLEALGYVVISTALFSLVFFTVSSVMTSKKIMPPSSI